MSAPTPFDDLPNLNDLKVAFDEVDFDFNQIVKFGIGLDVPLAGERLRWLFEDTNQLAIIARKLCNLINQRA